ncbi:MAG TPA: ATP-binding protein [Candidatus Atribacteria bacterium]|nr:ATP-binding protein [Candidatus Atribacteria bacterium]
MDKNKLKELLIEYKQRFLTARTDLIRREVQDNIEPFIKFKEVVIITGPRRGGKSSLMKLICDDLIKKDRVLPSNILYLNFEDERFIEFNAADDFAQIYELFLQINKPAGRLYFFLDEIQNVTGWERWVNRLYENENIKIFLTGSNASLLDSEISTALTGRNRTITNFPFSFGEFLDFKNYRLQENDFYQTKKRAVIKSFFQEYLKLGGYPEIVKINDPTLLEQYFKDIIYRDILPRYSIKKIKEIRELCLFLTSNLGSIHSYNRLQNLIGVKSLNTVKSYLEILEEVFLFFRINLFDYSIKRQIYNPSKIYIIDTALGNSISFKFSENIGHIYENLVFLELKRRNKEIYYWKSKKGKEVDFLIKKGLNIEEAIQVSYNLNDKKTLDREIESLLIAKDEFKIEHLSIITEDEEMEKEIEGAKIKIIPLWKWLLIKGNK